MKALIFRQHGDLDQLEYADMAEPVAGPHEALVRVRAVALNHLDLWVRRGLPGLQLPLPHIGGSDIAGVVAAVGEEVDPAWVGRPVVINPALACGQCELCRAGQQSLCSDFKVLGEHTPGGMAEYVVAPAANLYAIPPDFPFERAAAVPLVFQTAWRALIGQARLRAGERVAIVGAGGGVATAAIQIAKLAGAYVYAITSTPEKEARARALGADETLNYRTVDPSREIRRRTGRRGVDVVLENVGPATWSASLRMLVKGGRLVTFGATTGRMAETDLNLLFWNQLHLIGSTMANYAEFDQAMAAVFSGRLQPVVDRTLPLQQGREAQRLLLGVHRQPEQQAGQHRSAGPGRGQRGDRAGQRQHVVEVGRRDREIHPHRNETHHRPPGPAPPEAVDLPEQVRAGEAPEDLRRQQGLQRRGNQERDRPDLQHRRRRVQVQAAARVVEVGQRPRALVEEMPGQAAVPGHPGEPGHRPGGQQPGRQACIHDHRRHGSHRCLRKRRECRYTPRP